MKFEIYLFSSTKVREAVASLQQLAENVQSKTEQVKKFIIISALAYKQWL